MSLIKSAGKLFPNPAHGVVNLTDMDFNVSSIQSVALISTLGIEIKYLMHRKSEQFENTLSIELDGISPGVYFLKTLSDSNVNMYKIIVGSL
jgi:hypothetical protein